MTRRIWLCLLAVLAALLTACGPNSGSGGGEIVVTTNILGDVVR
ncbi:MAG: zinc ABC transporter substrate-binding protein, partial [Mycolicibacterium neoaurum]|nr:zinc ABC transporter substrate-binding protein [Mycolicibacterium neoaurum]